ncbi:glucokinase [Candidatus Woesearchaeota archaeon]|nr:glucokinase [Candidatus Woesearchaeota archaeon]
MNFKLQEFSKKRNFKEFVLGGDIGGTNTSLVVAGVKNKKPELLFSLHYETKKLKNLQTAINHILNFAKEKYNIKIKKACLAVAGVILNNHYAELNNIRWNIDTKIILKKTGLKKITLINDFEAVAYAVNILSKKDLIRLNKIKPEKNKVKSVIGAGTGLGKTILYFDKHSDSYLTLPTEGGHEDFPSQNNEELELVKHIQKSEKTKKPVSYEMLLSGDGLARIYSFVKKKLGKTKITKIIDNSKEKSILISKYRKKDRICKKTFQIFTKIYAKACKNFSLTTLCFGGLYIAGGIAMKNSDIFNKEFISEFQNNPVFSKILKKIPIFIIKDYDVSLYGSIFAAAL